jgi:hypothetical protein
LYSYREGISAEFDVIFASLRECATIIEGFEGGI